MTEPGRIKTPYDSELNESEEVAIIKELSKVIIVNLIDDLQDSPKKLTQQINQILEDREIFNTTFPGEPPSTQLAELLIALDYFSSSADIVSGIEERRDLTKNRVVCVELNTDNADDHYWINGELVLERAKKANNEYDSIILLRNEIDESTTYAISIIRSPQQGNPATTIELKKKTTNQGFESVVLLFDPEPDGNNVQ